jgi:hypothetical protein
MLDHLSIDVLGVLRGSADGPLAVGFLGAITLAAVILMTGRIASRGGAAMRSVFGDSGKPKLQERKAGPIEDCRVLGGTDGSADSHARDQ